MTAEMKEDVARAKAKEIRKAVAHEFRVQDNDSPSYWAVANAFEDEITKALLSAPQDRETAEKLDGFAVLHGVMLCIAQWTGSVEDAREYAREAADRVGTRVSEAWVKDLEEYHQRQPASPSPVVDAGREQNRFEADAERISALVNHLPEVQTLPDQCGEDVWPHVERALVAVGNYFSTTNRIAIKDEAREEAAKTIRRQIDALLEKYGSRERDTNATTLPPDVEEMIAELSEREEEILLLKGQP